METYRKRSPEKGTGSLGVMAMDEKKTRGEIHLGDLARVVKELRCNDPEHLEIIATCLGFKLSKADIQKNNPKTIIDPHRTTRKSQLDIEHRKGVNWSPPSDPEIPVSLPDTKGDGVLSEIPKERMPPAPPSPAWLNEETKVLTPQVQIKPVRSTLFDENTYRGIFTALLATQRTGPDIDRHKVIEETLRYKILRRLPMETAGTLDRGCQLLLDYNDTMTPFWEDLFSLEQQIAALLSPETLETYRYVEDPCQAYSWKLNGKTIPWKPNARPVLVATDFGIHGRKKADISDTTWPVFIERCRNAGCPILILIPWHDDRWPDDLGPYPGLVYWNPSTTAAMVRQIIGRGHGISP